MAAECAPFVKVGGLADVVGTLPPALHRLGGHTVKIIVPHYGAIDDARFNINRVTTFKMAWNQATTRVEVSHTSHEEIDIYFVRGWPFFSADENFIYNFDEGINVGRYLFFCAAGLEWIKRLAKKEGWLPDLIHLHDWHTGLAAYLLGQVYITNKILRGAATLFSIHNMMYQGWGVEWHLIRAGLPLVDLPLLRVMGKTDNALAIGIAYSTMLSTVSPTYAEEISTMEGGYGLDGLLHARTLRMTGILNGIDVERWNPATSKAIPVRYNVKTLDKRLGDKLALQAELNLPEDGEIPLVATVTRLVDQKGIDIMIPALRHILLNRQMQFVVLGSGMPHYEDAMRQLEAEFPGKAAARYTFNEPLSERIYAGSDMFLMPSLFEPCGIGQMIAMHYGSLPVVRRVGGLADTVDPQTGFLFGPYDMWALVGVMNEALDRYQHDQPKWQTMQKAAMRRDFAWESSARRYLDLYQDCVEVHRAYA